MDTDSNIPAEKKVDSVEILHLDDLGYGPQGKHTRREWRKECLDNLLAGRSQFEFWQASWQEQINKELLSVNLAAKLIFEDDSQEDVLFTIFDLCDPYSLDFVGEIFERNVVANDLVFKQAVYFTGAIFEGEVFFYNSIFNGYANFSTTTFSRGVNCISTKFEGMTSFIGANFLGPATFNNAMFKWSADFTSGVFIEHASYQSATFQKNANFCGATYSREANFQSATFTGDADFTHVTFLGLANYEGTIFARDADYGSATFANEAHFTQTTFSRQCHFQNSFDFKKMEWSKETSFVGKVDFENVVFKNVGHFERVRFTKHTPAFRGCQIDNTRLEFSDEDYFPRDESSEDAIKNISFLKRLADEHGQTDQALNFNAMELRAKRLQTEPRPATYSFKAVTWLYEYISDYGRSFIKPLKYYFILLGVVFLIALGCAAYYSPVDCKKENLRVLSDLWRDDTPCDISAAKPDDKIRLDGYRAAAEYTIYRAAGILDFSDNGKATDAVARRLFGQSYEPGWMRFIGLIKAIASTALLFLAALGIRNKYRIK